jgi:hypothetical protein
MIVNRREISEKIADNLQRLMTCFQDGSVAEHHLEDALVYACVVLKEHNLTEALDQVAVILEVGHD